MVQSSQYHGIVQNIILLIISLGFRYLAISVFLFPLGILIGVFLSLLIILTEGNISFSIFSYFAFLNPNLALDEVHLELEDFYPLYFFIAFIVWIVFGITKYVIEKRRGKKITLTFPKKLAYVIGGLTLFYGIFFLLLPFVGALSGGSYWSIILMIVFLYVISIPLLILSMFLGFIADYIMPSYKDLF